MLRAVLAVLIVSGCAADPPVETTAESLAERMTLVAGDDTHIALFAGDAPRGPESTDVRLPRPMLARFGASWRTPPVPVLTGAVLADTVAWVGTDGSLFIDDGLSAERIADGVLPELAVSPSGRLLAFALRPGPTAGVRIWDGHRVRGVTSGLGVADRPLFVDEDRLVVVGARRGGIAGVWLADARGSLASPLALTNADLRAGRPLGASFVPPPASHASMRVEAGVLSYFDGRGRREIALPGAR